MSQIPRRSFTRLALAIVVPLVILLAVYYGGGLNLGGDPTRLTAAVPGDVTLDASGTTKLPLKLSLLNRTGETITLRAADPCKVLRWVIQAPGEATIQSKGDACLSGETTVFLASGATVDRNETLPLETVRYVPGTTYTVYIDFYGYVAKAEFEAVKP